MNPLLKTVQRGLAQTCSMNLDATGLPGGGSQRGAASFSLFGSHSHQPCGDAGVSGAGMNGDGLAFVGWSGGV